MAPITSAAPPSIIRTLLIASSNGPSSAPQFSETTDTSPIAPAAIRNSPRGIFTPENARSAPSARRAPLTYAVNSSIFCLYSAVEKSSKTGFIPSDAPAPVPPEAAPPPDSLLISSKLARDLLAFLAADPTPSTAFASL